MKTHAMNLANFLILKKYDIIHIIFLCFKFYFKFKKFENDKIIQINKIYDSINCNNKNVLIKNSKFMTGEKDKNLNNIDNFVDNTTSINSYRRNYLCKKNTNFNIDNIVKDKENKNNNNNNNKEYQNADKDFHSEDIWEYESSESCDLKSKAVNNIAFKTKKSCMEVFNSFYNTENDIESKQEESRALHKNNNPKLNFESKIESKAIVQNEREKNFEEKIKELELQLSELQKEVISA